MLDDDGESKNVLKRITTVAKPPSTVLLDYKIKFDIHHCKIMEESCVVWC